MGLLGFYILYTPLQTDYQLLLGHEIKCWQFAEAYSCISNSDGNNVTIIPHALEIVLFSSQQDALNIALFHYFIVYV